MNNKVKLNQPFPVKGT